MSRHRPTLALGIAATLLSMLVATPAAAARDRTAPSAPSNLRITASSANTVSLAWNKSTDNSSTFWYCVQTNGSGCIRVDPPRTTLTRTMGIPDRTFTFSVYAVDAAGNRSANSNPVSFTTPADTTPPGPVPVITVNRLLPTRVVLTWPEPRDDVSPQVWWTLFVNGDVAGYADRLAPPTQTLLTLTPQTTYVFQVSVRDREGNSVSGPPLSVTTPPKTDDNPPTAPTGLRASTPDGLDLELRWNASTDDTDPSSELRYDVYANGVLAAVGLGTRTILSCYTDDPVSLFVKAVDTSGNESAAGDTVVFRDCAP